LLVILLAYHLFFVFANSISSINSLKNFERSCVPSPSEDMFCTPSTVHPLLACDPSTQAVWNSMKKLKTNVVPVDSNKLMVESPPSKDAEKGFGILFQTPLADFSNVSGSKRNGDQVGDVGRPKRLRVGEKDERGKELPGRDSAFGAPTVTQAGSSYVQIVDTSSTSRPVLKPFFWLSVVFTDTSSLPRSRRDYMEALSSWDYAWLDRLDLTQKRKLVVDGAVSAYKTVVLCTMMTGYEMVSRSAPERPKDDMSCVLEEGEKKASRSHCFPPGCSGTGQGSSHEGGPGSDREEESGA